MEDTGDFSLLCQETDSCLNETDEEDEGEISEVRSDYDPIFLFSEEEDEVYVRGLVRKETPGTRSGSETPPYRVDSTIAFGGWISSARLDAVHWILNTGAMFGFQHQTAYLSIAYFDQFLSRRSLIEEKYWAIRLLSIACLSIAAKMEETRVPPLSEFPSQDYAFETNVIQIMELLVLSTLGWKMALVTPFAYLDYFVHKFFHEIGSFPRGLIPSAEEFLLDIPKEIGLLDYRPSVIAAAAILAASDGKLTRKDLELKLKQISLWEFQGDECAITCYNLMQTVKTGKSRMLETANCRDLSSRLMNSADASETSSVASSDNTRRRLLFDDSDRIFPEKKPRSK